METGRLPGEPVSAVTFFEMHRPAWNGHSLEAGGNQKKDLSTERIVRVIEISIDGFGVSEDYLQEFKA